MKSVTTNVRFPGELYALKQLQVNETGERNRAVSLHELILEAVKEKTSNAE